MDYQNPRRSAPLIRRLAQTYYNRNRASLGASHDVDDVEQEIWIVWHRVVAAFDPQRGKPFEALLTRSIKNRMIELSKFHARRANVGCISVNQSYTDGDGAETDLIETIAANEKSVLQQMIEAETREIVMKEIDERLKLMIEAIENPPEILRAEIAAMNAKADRAEEMGISGVKRDVDLNMMTSLFGLARCSRYRMIDRMNEVIEANE